MKYSIFRRLYRHLADELKHISSAKLFFKKKKKNFSRRIKAFFVGYKCIPVKKNPRNFWITIPSKLQKTYLTISYNQQQTHKRIYELHKSINYIKVYINYVKSISSKLKSSSRGCCGACGGWGSGGMGGGGSPWIWAAAKSCMYWIICYCWACWMACNSAT